MEENMCQKQISISEHSPISSSRSHYNNCHRCKMCSSFSSCSSTSSVSSSSSSTTFSSISPSSTFRDARQHKKQLPRQTLDKKTSGGCLIQQHLQSMFGLLRREETLKMAVRLESAHAGRTRYLVVVSRTGKSLSEECCLLGIDCNKRTTVGLVLRVLADTKITLDGDGGFSVSVCGRQHIFKPVSVQAMWSALQTLYKAGTKAGEYNYFQGGSSHQWVEYYEQRIESDRSCINEWHTMNDIESRRPPSPDSLRSKPRERLETERVIRSTLKEIMMSVDLDEVTSKYIRTRLEEQLDMDLREFKSFIDQEMLVILGQMDAATEIFPHVYLGSEWNASNLEELNKNQICYILNVTREIDNFFPGTFDYLNIRVYDDDNTDLLKHWDNTYKYITKVKKENSKVLVHCKMGISRSASVVIAYAMKAYNWDFKKAFEYVRKKRGCIKPNQNFVSQLETYQGMLDAMKNKEKLQRSKSETNLKSTFTKNRFHAYNKKKREDHSVQSNKHADSNEKRNEDQMENDYSMLRVCSGTELARLSLRPKSWSPDNLMSSEIFSSTGTMSQSLEQLNTDKLSADSHSSSASSLSTSPPRIPPAPPLPPVDSRYNLNVRMPCENGLAYSVSQNKIVQLYSAQNRDSCSSESMEIPSSVCANKIRHSSEHGCSDAEKVLTSGETQNFTLQLPSQFQGNSTIYERNENVNLVKKTLSHVVNEESQRKRGLSQTFAQRSESTAKSNTFDGGRDVSRVAVGSCYQNDEHKRNTLFSGEISSQDGFKKNNWKDNASPNVINTVQCSSVKHRTNLLERLTNSRPGKSGGLYEKDDEGNKGIVLNLKKEFEAKCNVPEKNKQRKKYSCIEDSNNNEDSGNSNLLIKERATVGNCNYNKLSSVSSTEDFSVRKLVGKYEVDKSEERIKIEKKQPPIPPRKSSLDIQLPPSRPAGKNSNVFVHSRSYRGVGPIVKSFLSTPNEIKSTVTKAANKLQQGKNHPLKLTFCKQRSNPPVYNTM